MSQTTYSPEKDLLAAVYAILNGDDELKTATGINPANNAPRPVAIYQTLTPNAPLPYVRFQLAGPTQPIQGETHNIAPVKSWSCVLMVDVFSDWQPELYNLAGRLRHLLSHASITTAHYTGSTWGTATDYFTDDTTTPDKVIRRASLRFRVDLIEQS